MFYYAQHDSNTQTTQYCHTGQRISKNRCGEEILRFAQNDRTTEPVMLERSEASNTRTCHPERVKRRGISIKTKEEIPHTWLTLAPTGVDLRFGMTEPQNLSCWNEVKHLTRGLVIPSELNDEGSQ